jgi:hypothetical protein
MLMDFMEASALLKRHGIRSIESAYVKDVDSALRFAKGMPIALKLISEKAMHKSRAGLVRLNLSRPEEIKGAMDYLLERGRALAPYKVLAQMMSQGGTEAIIGGKEDAQFGKVIMFGLGGVLVEAFKDTALRVCPIDQSDATDMVGQLRSKDAILASTDPVMLADMLVRVSGMLYREKAVKELDLNPVILRKDGYDIVDIRVIV